MFPVVAVGLLSIIIHHLKIQSSLIQKICQKTVSQRAFTDLGTKSTGINNVFTGCFSIWKLEIETEVHWNWDTNSNCIVVQGDIRLVVLDIDVW